MLVSESCLYFFGNFSTTPVYSGVKETNLRLPFLHEITVYYKM